MVVVDPSENSSRTAWLRRDKCPSPVPSDGDGERCPSPRSHAQCTDLGEYRRILLRSRAADPSFDLGQAAISLDLRNCVNSGLMSFFFLVVGLQARREFDIGEFRERPKIILQVLAGLGGMLDATGLYLAINAGRTSAYGWACPR